MERFFCNFAFGRNTVHASAKQINLLCSRLLRIFFIYLPCRNFWLMANNKDMGFLTIKHSSKMADILDKDVFILPLLYHFGIDLGFGEASVEDVCLKYGIKPELFITMCRVYALKGYVPDCSAFDKDDLGTVSRYIHQSHVYYLNEALPELDRQFAEVLGCYEEVHRKVLSKFYSDYRTEVDKHFEYEEKTVLPYIGKLLAGDTDGDYSIADFEDNHSDIEENLYDLRNIIVKYLPGDAPYRMRYGLLTDIIRFGNELDKHTFIENRILVPIALKIEKNG